MWREKRKIPIKTLQMNKVESPWALIPSAPIWNNDIIYLDCTCSFLVKHSSIPGTEKINKQMNEWIVTELLWGLKEIIYVACSPT